MSVGVERAAVVYHPLKDYGALLAQIREMLGKRGITVVDYALPLGNPDEQVPAPPPLQEASFVICLGGDGTLLFTARLFYGIEIPVLAVNLGTFGFLTEICRNEIFCMLEDFLEGRCEVEQRILLEVRVHRKGRQIGWYTPLNEVVIGRRELSRLLTLETHVDGQYLCTYRADGLIVSTPTGSTAYSLSALGPILMPTLDNLILNPICPHSLASRPFILSGTNLARVVVRGHDVHPVLSVDVQLGMELQLGDEVLISRAQHRLSLVRSQERTFFQVLREKLGWIDQAE